MMQNKLSGTALDRICLLICPAFSLQCANASVPSSGTAGKLGKELILWLKSIKYRSLSVS